jgi:hypothetical protein
MAQIEKVAEQGRRKLKEERAETLVELDRLREYLMTGNVYLRRQKEIDRYYQEVGTHNLYHLKRYWEFSRWRKEAG